MTTSLSNCYEIKKKNNAVLTKTDISEQVLAPMEIKHIIHNIEKELIFDINHSFSQNISKTTIL